ncbi:hypothetical protein OHA72_26610 [Dactylosporangium sp. NBC_01737]|uniref:hypothetical protein n=1 Tax=Dactylosporangium sp. NBC_01737 TaxID=2975959 RepID=UPI002E0F0623|nr:hypothetical protein OHA72_26610 [Dactylosporangium sp. NBC_01737]
MTSRIRRCTRVRSLIGVAVRGREWYVDGETGAGAVWAVQGDAAAECFGAVFEADEAGAVGEVGAADAVVVDCDVQGGVGGDGDGDD